ncbi:MAG: hypothetical protein NT120_05215, partial [Candidatus Aenigmarchaeota archaeon]|nr:hypothetical protein [Candidatus Aenigmarchaeota archaeon]
FLKRKELIVNTENPEEATPAKAVLQQHIAKHFSKDVESIEILDIMPKKGMPRSIARIYVWDEKKVADLSKKEEKEEKKEEATPKAEAKAEKKSE